ncbi:dUTP diphosphatase [Fluviispira vulneris]|uniref:dUTP diphosphatase n=1 Tax=Fluviispira vulneris TaxID=2763012 RepID=UPI001644572A|nr:dUTP diphosphatase [Fluviispira vulneris]
MLRITIINTSNNDVFYATEKSVGFDIPSNQSIILLPFQTKIIKTGLSFKVEDKSSFNNIRFELQIRPRSSSLIKENLYIQLGTIDQDYTGEIHVIVKNLSPLPKRIKKGQRIAQGVISSVYIADNVINKNKKRNNSGFGSTGK